MGWLAIAWVAIICVLFVLPTASPITATNFNYTIVAVAVVLGGAWLWWMLGAKRWFTGPRHTVEEPDGVAPTSPAVGATPDATSAAMEPE